MLMSSSSVLSPDFACNVATICFKIKKSSTTTEHMLLLNAKIYAGWTENLSRVFLIFFKRIVNDSSTSIGSQWSLSASLLFMAFVKDPNCKGVIPNGIEGQSLMSLMESMGFEMFREVASPSVPPALSRLSFTSGLGPGP